MLSACAPEDQFHCDSVALRVGWASLVCLRLLTASLSSAEEEAEQAKKTSEKVGADNLALDTTAF